MKQIEDKDLDNLINFLHRVKDTLQNQSDLLMIAGVDVLNSRVIEADLINKINHLNNLMEVKPIVKSISNEMVNTFKRWAILEQKAKEVLNISIEINSESMAESVMQDINKELNQE